MTNSLSRATIAFTLLLASCSSESSTNSASSPTPPVATSTGTLAPLPTTTTIAPLVEADPLPCDPLDNSACLLPWPNDAFTTADSTTASGRRLAINAAAPPRNASGKAIDVTDQNRGDGFSPGSTILVHVPEIDLDKSGIAQSTNIGRSLEPQAPILLLDTTIGSRWPYWAELDARATAAGQQLLMIHPANSLLEGHHYVVALQHLMTATSDIPRAEAFVQALADTQNTARAEHLSGVLQQAVSGGADQSAVYMAWDFTVASSQSLAGRLLHIRTDAYASVGSSAPGFSVSDTSEAGGVRTIAGTFEVPNYLTGTGGPGSTFDLDADGLPRRNQTTPTLDAPFICLVPTAPVAPTPVVVYGHGLLGSRAEVLGLQPIVGLGRLSVCGTDWIGMSAGDIPNLAGILTDLSNFNQQADRLQQGLLNMQFLGRAINAPNGFVADSNFIGENGDPLIAPGRTSLLGNSQGGILGGAASAVSTEWTNVVLGVPGINYSLLLPRSSDWPQFEAVFNIAYTTDIDRVLTLQLIQLLWDRGENDGYAQHLTSNTYQGISPKKVLLIGAFGDHQVANVSLDILVRTIGAGVHAPALRDGRSLDTMPFAGIEEVSDTIVDRSLLVMWDYGNPAPPTVNLPPTEPEFGEDPHGKGSSEPRVIQFALAFLLDGVITVPCDGPCVSDSVTP